MARRLKGYRKINIDGKIYNWKVFIHYYGRYIRIYHPDWTEQEVSSDEYYGNIRINITPAFVEYCIRNNISKISNKDAENFLKDNIREKNLLVQNIS